MTFELKDMLAWLTAIITLVAQFFHLKGRIAVIEARQHDMRETFRDGLEKIDKKLDAIDMKLDRKADK